MNNRTKNRVPFFLMVMVVAVGVIISSLGIYFVSRQRRAMELNLENQTSELLQEVLGQLNGELQKKAELLLEELSIPREGRINKENLTASIKKGKKYDPLLMQNPFFMSMSGDLIYPQAPQPVLPLQERLNQKSLSVSGGVVPRGEIWPTVDSLFRPLIKDGKVRTLYIEAKILEFKYSKLDDAIKGYKKCQLLTRDEPVKSFFLNAIGRCYYKKGEYKKGLRIYQLIRDQHSRFLTGEKRLLFYRVLRQIALGFTLVNDQGTAWIKYFYLYKRLMDYERNKGGDLFVFLKNEALDFLLRHEPPDFPVFLKEDFAKVMKNAAQLELSELDLRLNRLYKQSNGAFWHQETTAIPQAIAEIFADHLQMSRFYLAIQKYTQWQQLKGTQTKIIIINDKDGEYWFPVALQKIGSRFFFGFWLSIEYLEKNILPDMEIKKVEEAGFKVFVDEVSVHSDFKYEVLALPIQPFFPGHNLILASQIQDFVQKRIRRDTWISYGLIGILILTFMVGIFLFYKYISREAQLVRLKSDFFDSVSHTLKTPLTRMSLLAEAIQDGCVDDVEKRERFFNTVISETARMNEMLNNMLSLSKVESDKKAYQPDRLAFQDVLDSILARYAGYVKSLGFTLEVNLDQHIPLLKMDHDAVNLIILNLLQNAVKYSLLEKFIRVELFRRDEQVFLQIEDHGLGIAQEDLKKIFNKFYRAQDERVKAIEGSGLGLFLVQHAVAAHGGQIFVTSQPGQGTTFTIKFPVEGLRDE